MAVRHVFRHRLTSYTDRNKRYFGKCRCGWYEYGASLGVVYSKWQTHANRK